MLRRVIAGLLASAAVSVPALAQAPSLPAGPQVRIAAVTQPLPRIAGRIVVVGAAGDGQRRWSDLVDGFPSTPPAIKAPALDDLINTNRDE